MFVVSLENFFPSSLSWCPWFFDIYNQLQEISVKTTKKRRIPASNFLPWWCIGLNSRRCMAAIGVYAVDVRKCLGGCAAYWAVFTTIRAIILRLKTDAKWRCSRIWTGKLNFLRMLREISKLVGERVEISYFEDKIDENFPRKDDFYGTFVGKILIKTSGRSQ